MLWLAYAYSLAFGSGSDWIGGLGKVFLNGVEESSLTGDIPETVFSMFQLPFAIITPALVVGGFAERREQNMGDQGWLCSTRYGRAQRGG